MTDEERISFNVGCNAISDIDRQETEQPFTNTIDVNIIGECNATKIQ